MATLDESIESLTDICNRDLSLLKRTDLLRFIELRELEAIYSTAGRLHKNLCALTYLLDVKDFANIARNRLDLAAQIPDTPRYKDARTELANEAIENLRTAVKRLISEAGV